MDVEARKVAHFCSMKITQDMRDYRQGRPLALRQQALITRLR
jgi:hypothetical protein